MKTTSASADEYIGRYYILNVPRARGRYEPIKLVKTIRGWRVIVNNHWQWPRLSTACFSLSLRQLQERINSGRWVQDLSMDPDLQVSEGL